MSLFSWLTARTASVPEPTTFEDAVNENAARAGVAMSLIEEGLEDLETAAETYLALREELTAERDALSDLLVFVGEQWDATAYAVQALRSTTGLVSE